MHTRYMERTNSMAKGKRVMDPGAAEEGQPDRKRPALASVIVEALKVDSLQRLCSSLEPILRRVVSEEVERALAKLGPARLTSRPSPKRIEGPDGRNLQLHFRSRLSIPLFTGGKVEGEQGAAIHIVLIDAHTGHVVTSGPESSAKLDVVVLEGDFNDEDDDDWTQEDFESHVVKEREGRRPLLNGELQVTLKEGVGTLGELTFTDNSSWIRSRQFRLGLKVSSGYCEGIRVREAKTEAFAVRDHRGELYKKHYPPALNDEVWRLEKIGKDGAFHKRLNKAGIRTVEDFLRYFVRDKQNLRSILGGGMSNRMWDTLVEHAKTCVLSEKVYVYYPEDARSVGVVFNHIYELSGLISGEQYYSADSLTDSQKVYVDTLVKKAYDNWINVVEYDGKALSNFKQDAHVNVSQTTMSYSGIFNHHQPSLPSLPPPMPTQQPSMNRILASEGHDVAIRYPAQSQDANLHSSIQFNGAAFPQHNQLISEQTPAAQNANLPALGLQQTSASAYPNVPTPNMSSYRTEDFFSEDEIRMRSHEMLENDDMQHYLLRLFSIGANSQPSMAPPDDSFTFPSMLMPHESPDYGYTNEDRAPYSGKAVVGWLKLKAALRWGIFIRKQAADKRTQIVELDDS
uniref:Calmodulin-binding protein n=1 Tax=Kalanchoe fedtschenkoi TaxID=63787 RepID=A0A7N0TJR1_KALFE